MQKKNFKNLIIPLGGYHDHPNIRIPKIADTIAFTEKMPVIFWRGVLSGRFHSGGMPITAGDISIPTKVARQDRADALRTNLRYKVSYWSLSADFIDAGLVGHWNDWPWLPIVDLLAPVTKPKVPMQDQLTARYLLALDGYDGPSSWYWQLQTNSLVMRQESDWEMFGDCYFQPWVHFVPIAADGSDLQKKFEWCERNPAACKTMVANANAAWNILFDPSYQLERRRRNYQEYSRWFC